MASAPQEIRNLAVAADLPGVPERYRLPVGQRKKRKQPEDAAAGETI